MTRPRNHTARSDLPTRGGQAAMIAKAKGRPYLPWQRHAADVALEYYPETGLYRYSIIVITVQRQAGKTTWVGVLADHRCMTQPSARVWFTMDTGKKADSWMRQEHLPTVKAWLGDPKRRGAHWTQSLRAGELGPMWPNSSSFLTFPPTDEGLHSKQADMVILSEAWALSREQGEGIRQAARPTMNTRYQHSLGMHGAQLVIDSTLGDDASGFLDDYYAMGLESLTDPNTRVCFIDYGIPHDADPTDLDIIREWHPAYGLTFTEQALLDGVEEFKKDPAGFARAYGNRATRSRVSAFPPGVWTAAGTVTQERPDRAGIAVDATPSGNRLAIAAGWRADNGHGYIEVLEADAPTREHPRIVAQLAAANGNQVTATRDSVGVLELLDAVARHDPKVDVRLRSAVEFGSDCAALDRGIRDKTVHHFNDRDLDAAVEIAAKGSAGDGGFRWVRKNAAGSIAELVAGTLALGAFDALPAPKRRAVAVM